jgi:hypothetical protein
MRFSGRRYWSLAGVIGLALGLIVQAALADNAGATNKVIVYPGPTDSIDQLKRQGVEKVDNYGSYWVAEVGDKNLAKVKAAFGNRVVPANDLNLIKLRAASIDTTGKTPAAPAGMEQVENPGRRLRIVQFKGPIQPGWLAKLKGVKGAKVINYVPNNAYLVFLDAAAEKEVRALRDPAGPVQWVGAYHPSYKLTPAMEHADYTMDVNVAVVDAPESDTALEFIRSFAQDTMPAAVRAPNQRMISARIDATALSEIAKMPEVLWIDPINRIRPMDEVQDLILASDTNSPGPGVGAPLPPALGGQHYLDFLTSAVGGGNANFTNPLTYPIIDIADSGFTAGIPGILDFFQPGFGFRVEYETYDVSCGAYNIAKQTGNSNIVCVAEIKLGGGDDTTAIGHGTVIASIISGFNTNSANQDPSGFQFGMGVSPYGLIGSTRVFSPDVIVDDAPTCLYHVDDVFCANNFPQLIFNEYEVRGRISNNSWDEGLVFGSVANANAGLYNATCQQYDIGVRDAQPTGATNTPSPFPLNQEMIMVFANGNAGNIGNVGGFGDTTLTPPATAKNVISVGATTSVRMDGSGCETTELQDNSFKIAAYSAFGPTLDGRFKPEIVAPDTTIYGVNSTFWTNAATGSGGLEGDAVAPQILGLPADTNGIYLCGDGRDIVIQEPDPVAFDAVRGTSFSTPAISGGIQLLWWYFQNRLTDELGTPLLQPSPAMAKAYLCNSARYLSITNSATGAMDTLPSIAQGMGMMDLQRMFDSVPRVIRDESTRRAIDTPLITTNPVSQQTFFSQSGQSYEASGQVFDPTKPFRVTLAWTDPAGVPSAGKELVNDLNLEVTVMGQTYKGNVFSGPNSVSGGTADSLNNMESVFLPAGQTGAWSVVVRAADIAGQGVPNVGSILGQDFAFVVYNAASTNRSDVPNLSTNNTCGTAIVITDDSSTFSNTLSTTGPNAYHRVHPSPSAAVGGSEEFFKLTNPTPGSAFTISTTGSSFDNVLSIWEVQVVPQAVFVRGECGALVEVTSTNGGISSTVNFTADGSNDYYIVAEPHNNGPGGLLVLNVNATISTISVTPSLLTFPSESVGLTSAVQNVTFQNNTIATPINISSATISGPNAADFIIESQSCAGGPVASGRNCSVNIAFSPTASGLRTGQLVITDDATGSPRIVPLSGTGTPAVPVLCLSSGSSTLSFGNQLLTTTSAVQSITITNCGSAALNISSVSVTSVESNDFTVAQTCTNGPIVPGGTCTLNVAFNPQVAGTRVATLVIADDASGGPTVLTVTGVGAALLPAICFDGSSVDFGSVGTGSTGSIQSVTITNCGSASLVFSNILLTGANPGDFILVSSSCATMGSGLSTGSACVVNLQFAPTAGGLRSANLTILDNASGSPQLLPLTGNGSLSRPDAAIGKTTNMKRMVGNGIINTTGAGQEVVQNIHRGAKKGLRFYVAVTNVGSAPDRFTVQGDGNDTGFTVTYYLGAIPNDSVEVSSAVESGVFSTSTLAAGATTSDSTMIRVEVFADKTLVSKGVTKTFNLTFTSVGDPTKVDVVKATVITR